MYAPSCSSRVSWFTVAIKSASVGGFLRLPFCALRFMDGMLSRVRAMVRRSGSISLTQAGFFGAACVGYRANGSTPHRHLARACGSGEANGQPLLRGWVVGARLGDRRAGTVVASGFLPSGAQLRVHANGVGTGRHLVRVTRAGAEVALAGRRECGVRVGSGGATKLVVRRGRPAGAGGPSVA